jgi:hypothetical protein
VTSAGADALISNHTDYDGSKTKLAAVARRKPGETHPYVIGADRVQRYLTTVDECAQAGLRTPAPQAWNHVPGDPNSTISAVQ